jgi:peroxisomal 3,2-trans-enoyl-CoA isomerase
MADEYPDIKFEIRGQIGIIKVPSPLSLPHPLPQSHQLSLITQFNRPKSLNSFGGSLIPSTIAALRVLNSHPDTVFTVLTGEGRFFSAGADVTGIAAVRISKHSIPSQK